MHPSISVILPVYNAETTIKESIDSILRQSFEDFELIIIDDGSTDTTKYIINSYNDSRIRYIESEHNYVSSLNLGLALAKGKYIARMDADDIMLSDRLGIQYQILEEEPKITVCSTWYIPFGEGIQGEQMVGMITGLVKSPLLWLLQGNPIAHPTTMFRSNFIKEHQLSYQNYPYAEDYKLWIEIAKLGGQFYIESQPLLRYRISASQVTNRYKEAQRATALRIQRELLDILITKSNLPELMNIKKSMYIAQKKGILAPSDIFAFFIKIFKYNIHI